MELRNRTSPVAVAGEQAHLANSINTINEFVRQNCHQLHSFCHSEVGHGLIVCTASINQNISASAMLSCEGPTGGDSVLGACICG